MASGVKVADQVKQIYDKMKVVKTDDDAKERIRLVKFHISGGYIDVHEIYREKDLEGQDVYQFFLNLLKPQECCYLMYDCHFSTTETAVKEELVFVMWAPENAPIKAKMQYASSKDAMKKALPGMKHELQINDSADCNDRDHFAQGLSKKVTHLEGKPVCGGH